MGGDNDKPTRLNTGEPG